MIPPWDVARSLLLGVAPADMVFEAKAVTVAVAMLSKSFREDVNITLDGRESAEMRSKRRWVVRLETKKRKCLAGRWW